MNTQKIDVLAKYDAGSTMDLVLFQADKITYPEWNRRQKQHVEDCRDALTRIGGDA